VGDERWRGAGWENQGEGGKDRCREYAWSRIILISLPPSLLSSSSCLPIFLLLLTSRGELSLLNVWKNALEMFIHNKNMINNKHEFAIVILRDTAEWVSG
jgi:hypothetical protein